MYETRHKDLFSHYNLILRKTLRKNVLKSARKYKRNVLMPPGHPIILLKSNRMAAVSVKRPEKVYSKVWFFVIAPNKIISVCSTSRSLQSCN